jgi:hypothetical protein
VLLQLLDAFHLDVENAGLARALGGLHGRDAGAVVVAAELRVLEEAALRDELLEFAVGDEVVVFAVDFAGARGAGGVCGVGAVMLATVGQVEIVYCKA